MSHGDGNGLRDPARDRPSRRSRGAPRRKVTSSARRRSRATRSRWRAGSRRPGLAGCMSSTSTGAERGAPAHGHAIAAIVAASGSAPGSKSPEACGTSLPLRRPSTLARPGRWSARPRSVTRPSPVGWSRPTGPTGSPSRSTSGMASRRRQGWREAAADPGTMPKMRSDAVSPMWVSKPSRSPPSTGTACSKGPISSSTSGSCGSSEAGSSRPVASRLDHLHARRTEGAAGRLVGRALLRGPWSYGTPWSSCR